MKERVRKVLVTVGLTVGMLIPAVRLVQGEDLRWAPAPDLLYEARLSCGAYVDGSIYMLGGEHFGAYTGHNVVQRFDVATQTWSYAAPMQYPASRPEAVVLNGEIWRLCGDSYVGYQTVEIYSPATDTWRPGPSTISGHCMHGAAVVDGKIYVIDSASEVYDPAVGHWVSIPTLPSVGCVQIAPVDDLILVVNWTGKCVVFDTVSQTWQEEGVPAIPIAVGWQGWDTFRMTSDGNWAYLLTASYRESEPVRAFALDLKRMDAWVELTNVPDVPYPHADFTLVVENGNLHLLGRSYNCYEDPGGGPMYAHEVAPLPFPAGAPPVANAGPDQTLECTGPLTRVSLDGTASFDPDGDPLEYEWSAAHGVLLDDRFSATPSGLFPVGPTLVTLTVTDGNGGVATDDVLITVQDTQPPVVICTTDVVSLWPPDHRMVNVAIVVQASDTCVSPENLLVTCAVSSSEPDDGTGDGSFVGDVGGFDGYTTPVLVHLVYDELTGSYLGSVALRAERDGSQAGRTYSIVAEVMDCTGNAATASCVVLVPHDKRKK